MPDHVHMLVSIPPKISVVSFMGYLKGKSALMTFDRHANLKYKFGNRHFWSYVPGDLSQFGSDHFNQYSKATTFFFYSLPIMMLLTHQ